MSTHFGQRRRKRTKTPAKPWTEADEATLFDGIEQGLSCRDIGAALSRTEAAVRQHLKKCRQAATAVEEPTSESTQASPEERVDNIPEKPTSLPKKKAKKVAKKARAQTQVQAKEAQVQMPIINVQLNVFVNCGSGINTYVGQTRLCLTAGPQPCKAIASALLLSDATIVNPETDESLDYITASGQFNLLTEDTQVVSSAFLIRH